MNVLDRGTVPRVMSLGEALKAWLEHRKEVLVRRTQHRLEQIARRLEVLDGYIVAFLNLDAVIKIIREEDEPEAAADEALQADRQSGRGDPQHAPALAAQARGDRASLRAQDIDRGAGPPQPLLGSDKRQWGEITRQIGELKKAYGKDTALGRRKTTFADAPDADIAEEAVSAFIEREPITVVLSGEGLDPHAQGPHRRHRREGLQGRRQAEACACKRETTDKLLLLSTGGKVYTLAPDKLPGGRGQGEPLRLMVDLEEGQDFVDLFVHRPGMKRLVASSSGNGFIVPEDELIANTRKGKQVLNLSGDEEAKLIVPADGDTVAVIGENRKMIIFKRERAAGDGARQGRAPAEIQGRRPRRRPRVLRQGRAELVGFLGPHLRQIHGRAARLARRARPGRPPAADGIPAQQQIRLS